MNRILTEDLLSNIRILRNDETPLISNAGKVNRSIPSQILLVFQFLTQLPETDYDLELEYHMLYAPGAF